VARLTPIPWRRFEQFLFKVDCEYVRQKGSHRVYWRTDFNRPIIVPTYDDLPIHIIKNALRLLKISTEEYLRIIDSL